MKIVEGDVGKMEEFNKELEVLINKHKGISFMGAFCVSGGDISKTGIGNVGRAGNIQTAALLVKVMDANLTKDVLNGLGNKQ